MEEYNYTLKHIPGKDNIVADGLTRINALTHTQNYKISINFDEIYKTQERITLDENKNYTQMKIKEYAIWHDDKHRIIITDEYADKFLSEMHLKLMHPGENKLYRTLTPYFHITSASHKIKQVTKQCNDCYLNKSSSHHYGKVSGGINSNHTFEVVSSDIVGPIKTEHFDYSGKYKYFYILTLTDIFSRWTDIVIIFNITSDTVVQELQKMITYFLPVKKIITDQGRQYLSNNFKNFCKRNKMIHIPTTPYNPTGNSVSERLNGQINDIMRLSRKQTLKNLTHNIKTRLNLTNHRITNKTPFEIIHNTSPFQEIDINHAINMDKVKTLNQNNRNTNNTKTNSKRKEHIYNIGDKVYKKNHMQDKVQRLWLGPYSIQKIKDENTVYIDELTKVTLQNIKNLKPAGGERRMSHTISNNL